MTFIGLVFAVSCATNPVSGKKELARVSESSEIEMGRQGVGEVGAMFAGETIRTPPQ
jgi:hypothetical protein